MKLFELLYKKRIHIKNAIFVHDIQFIKNDYKPKKINK